jgi:hypothetical protein
MSSFCCYQTKYWRVRFAGDPAEIIRLVFIRVRIHAHSIDLYSGCEDLLSLSVHFTYLLCTVLHLWAKICQWVTNYFLPSNDSAMVLIFVYIYYLYNTLKILWFLGGNYVKQ